MFYFTLPFRGWIEADSLLNDYYLKIQKRFWLASPLYFWTSNRSSHMDLDGNGYVSTYWVNYENGGVLQL